MFCPNCGREIPDGTFFCPECGAETGAGNSSSQDQTQAQQNNWQDQAQNQQNNWQGQAQDQQNNWQGQAQGQQYQNGPVYRGTVVGDTTGIVPRNVAVAIVLSLVTCGIYSIYWFIVMTNEANQLSGRTEDTSGGIAFLLTLVTCGIYGWYWSYKMGEKTDIIKGIPSGGSSSVLFLVLQIFGLGIVNYAIAQDAINSAIS